MELIILYAVGLDLIIGDPRCIPHPVVYIGKAISCGESFIRRYFHSSRSLQLAGLGLTLLIVLGSYFFFWGLLYLAYKVNSVLAMVLGIFLMSQSLAMNSLYKHARAVAQPLSQGDLKLARQALGRIVGRDTEQLNEAEIIRGTVETVAENTVDGIIAPLFYGFIGGPPLALAYKAVNTLDSMIAYKDERYINLGRAAARLDDLANYLPARISAVLFLMIAPFTTGGLKGVWLGIFRDAGKHESPNSGIPEAAVAGALGIQLGGLNYYRDVPSERALMGEKKRTLELSDIRRSLILMALAAGEMLLLGFIICHLWP